MALAGAGADITVNFVSHAKEATEVETQILGLGRRCVTIQADVSRSQEVARLVNETENRIGQIDILINNAGISRPQPIEEITEQDWDDIITVNLKSCFLVTQAVLPGMRARKWGRIINVSSVAAQVGGVVGPHYAASKAGMHGLTRFYASRLAKEGITVNSIAPALVWSDMLAQVPNITPERIPVGRFGEPDEVAEAALGHRVGRLLGETVLAWAHEAGYPSVVTDWRRGHPPGVLRFLVGGGESPRGHLCDWPAAVFPRGFRGGGGSGGGSGRNGDRDRGVCGRGGRPDRKGGGTARGVGGGDRHPRRCRSGGL